MQEESSDLLGKVFSTTEETPEPVWEDGGEIFIGNVQKNKSRKKWRIFVYYEISKAELLLTNFVALKIQNYEKKITEKFKIPRKKFLSNFN